MKGVGRIDKAENFITELKIQGVYLINRPTFEDERGFFRETFRMSDLENVLGITLNIKQENHSRSKKGVLRGIHIAPWSKLVDVKQGEAQQVVVDLRKQSPTFGEHISLVIGDSNKVKIYIPPYCGNAILALSGSVDYTYLTDDYWSKGKELGVSWNDKDLNIHWMIATDPELSDKDAHNLSVKQYLDILK